MWLLPLPGPENAMNINKLELYVAVNYISTTGFELSMSGSASICFPNGHRVMAERSNVFEVKTFIADMASREGPAIKINWGKINFWSGRKYLYWPERFFYQGNIYYTCLGFCKKRIKDCLSACFDRNVSGITKQRTTPPGTRTPVLTISPGPAHTHAGSSHPPPPEQTHTPPRTRHSPRDHTPRYHPPGIRIQHTVYERPVNQSYWNPFLLPKASFVGGVKRMKYTIGIPMGCLAAWRARI